MTASQIYEVITPDSEDDITFEKYEFMLTWFSRKGTPVSWLFCDWENINKTKTNPINIDNEDEIKSLIDSESRIVTLTAEDITREQLDSFLELKVNKTVNRIYRDDSVLYEPDGNEKLAILDSSYKYIQSEQRFKIEIEVERVELALEK